jgi:hypothetical protein
MKMNFKITQILFKFFIFLFVLLINFSVYGEERLKPKDYDKLVDLGYQKLDAYADDYSKGKTYWFTLEEHLSVQPKYLALLGQTMKVNGKESVQQHIYNSKHHFFGDVESKCVKEKTKDSLLGSIIGDCKYLKPKTIDDSNISKENFAQLALDHCTETKVKKLTTEDGKELKVSDTKPCYIKYINFSKYEFAKVLKEVGKENKVQNQKSKKTNSEDMEKYKKQCEDLGFKPKTEKFGECVLKLMEKS